VDFSSRERRRPAGNAGEAGIGHTSFAVVAGEMSYYLLFAPKAPWSAAAWFGPAPKSAALTASLPTKPPTTMFRERWHACGCGWFLIFLKQRRKILAPGQAKLAHSEGGAPRRANKEYAALGETPAVPGRAQEEKV